MANIDPNSFDTEIANAQDANLQTPVNPEGTEQKETVKTEEDYRKKFIESAKGAQQLLREKQELEARLAKFETVTPPRPDVVDNLIPGFENLDPAEQDNLVAYTQLVTKKAEENLMARPAFAFAERSYNENKFNAALDVVVAQFPELSATKSEFKAQFFNPNNVPDNIQDILESMAKAHLYDKAKDIGALEAQAAADRVQLESTTGGDRTPSARRTLADWQSLARTNPAKFASLKKDYEDDIASGQLVE